MKQSFGLILFLLIGPLSHARLFLDVSILNKKGIDIGLTLGSELHSSEEVRPKEDIGLTMKSGMSVLLRAAFEDKPESGQLVSALNSLNEGEEEEVKKENKENKKNKEDSNVPISVIGPSSKVIIQGRVIGIDGKILKDFYKEPLVVKLGETKVVTHAKDSQLVEIKIKPHIQ